MIKGVSSGTPAYVKIGHFGGSGYINSYQPNAQGIGQVRFNTSLSNIEVWDGSVWMPVGATADISLTEDTIAILEWARKERDRQLRYEAMAKDNVTIADALESVKDAELRLRELAILCDTSNK